MEREHESEIDGRSAKGKARGKECERVNWRKRM